MDVCLIMGPWTPRACACTDAIAIVCSYLDHRSTSALLQVCTSVRAAVTTDPVWQFQLVRDFGPTSVLARYVAVLDVVHAAFSVADVLTRSNLLAVARCTRGPSAKSVTAERPVSMASARR